MEEIKKLRDITGAGIVDCKKALEEAGGEIDKAVEILRKRGEAKSAKKAERATNEGLIGVASDNSKKVSIVKILCETDFVARNDDFKEFVESVSKKGLTGSSEDYFNEKKDEMVLKIGENITFGGSEVLDGGHVSSYLHSNGKVAGVVVFNKSVDDTLATDIAMQVTAMSPDFVKPEDVPNEDRERESNIYRDQLKKEGKPDEIIDKIIVGKINKYLEDICLVKQSFIKEDKKTVEQVLKESDPGLEIVKFIRYSL